MIVKIGFTGIVRRHRKDHFTRRVDIGNRLGRLGTLDRFLGDNVDNDGGRLFAVEWALYCDPPSRYPLIVTSGSESRRVVSGVRRQNS